MKLILLLLLLANISCSNPTRFLSPTPRKLEQTLQFSVAKNLIFTDDSKWHFQIIYYSENQLEANTECTTSILYKGALSTAACKAASGYILNCELNQENQTKLDLVQLTNEKADGATITWTGIEETINIPISATLKYDDSYSLTYDTDTKDWTFKIKIKEDELPEGSSVKVDVDYKDSEKILANCDYSNKILNCGFNKAIGNSYTIKISQEKNQGSIDWEFPSPLEENYLVIPFALKVDYYTSAYDLELVDNHWNYEIFLRTEDLQPYHIAFTINSKIKNAQGVENLYFTRCNSVDFLGVLTRLRFKCKVYGDNQKKTDLVYVSNSNMNDISLIWDGKLVNDDIIVRKAELSFVKAYDLLYDSKKNYWTFKIEVADDEDLPNEAKVYVDIYAHTNRGNYDKICSFNEHILSCTKSGETGSSNLIEFQGYREKGSVTWKNVKQKHIPIPLNHEFIFKQVSGSFFTDKWNFFLTVTNTNSSPQYSKVIIDIKHNNVETTALCETLKQGSYKQDEIIYCTSNYDTQASTDKITLIQEKKLGSITWNSGLTDSNNIVTTSTLDEKSANVKFIDAYDLYFANNKWYFTLSTSANEKYYIGRYRVDIAVSGKSPSTATCFLKEGMYDARNILFLCKCDYANQSKDDLIYISKTKTEASSISFSSGLDSDYQIILKTELTIKKAHSVYRVGINNWFCKINIARNDNTVLPVNSIVYVDIFEKTYRAKCIAESLIMLSCESDYSSSTQIALGYFKRETSSVTWTNTNKNDYIISTESYTDPNPYDPNTNPNPNPNPDTNPGEEDPVDTIPQDNPEGPNQGQTGTKDKKTNSSNYYYNSLFMFICLILL